MLELRAADARGTGKGFGISTIRLLAPLMGTLLLPGVALTQGSGVAPDGQKGQLHVVVGGDTLWDITHHYIETPWIWPSIWQENANIQNPHLIYPGDLIWITDKSMHWISPRLSRASGCDRSTFAKQTIHRFLKFKRTPARPGPAPKLSHQHDALRHLKF